ncbi:fibronectin type III domain-containing protein [Xanthocytophaga agilis]|uniref:Fibronectin type III domain-containing protein n=1 Tax=Xanthocytophaga agilis TaxID=3048010 RepID=A0AAE3UFE2_9BACT|nr:fibronectin type III domain-containing protein [Xanthocytophaga agilis]MDJ1500478.1 fibronectin type III domain-containing protein [Xanthocytophaga agilis]
MPSIRQIFTKLSGGSTSPTPTIPGTFSLSVTPGNGLNTVAWTESTGAAYYILEYSLTGAGGWTQLGGQLNSLGYPHTGLTNGTQYYYRVTAYNSTGNRVSSIVSGTPSGSSASFSLAALALDKQNYLSWASYSGATGYQVQRRLSGSSNWANVGSVTTQTQYTDTDAALQNGEAYEYQVVAQGVSATSNAALSTPEVGNIMDVTMPAPTGVIGWCEASKKVQLIWRNGGTRSQLTYEVQYKNNSGSYETLTTITPELSDKGIYGSTEIPSLRGVEPKKYFLHDFSSQSLTGTNYYRIRAKYDNTFVSAWSTELQVTIQGSYVDTTAANFATTYAAQTAPGTVVRILSGTLDTANDVTLKPRISILNVAGSVNYTGQQQYSWDKGFLKVNNSTLTSMNLSITGLTIDCSNYTGRAGISCNKVQGLVISNCIISRSFWQGIQLGIDARDCVIYGCTLTNAGYGPPESGDPWTGEGNSFIGAITLRGNTTNIQIFDNIVSSPVRGYGFKALIDYINTDGSGNYYNVHSQNNIFNNDFDMGNRLWLGASPQFWGEIWAAESVNWWVFANKGKNQLSLEYRNEINRSYRHSVRVEQNLLTVMYKAALEVSNHDLVITRNVLDLRNVQNCQEVFGDYNKPSSGLYTTENLLIEFNLILLGSEIPNVQTHRNLTSNCINRNNTIISPNGFPYAYYNARTNDDGSSPNHPTNLTIENNVFQCPSANNVFITKKSTDGNAGGFAPFGNGQLTVVGTCNIRGNLFNASVQLMPTTTTGVNNNFTSGVAPNLVGGSDIRQMYKPAVGGNCHNTGSKIGKKYAGSAPDRGCYELAAS